MASTKEKKSYPVPKSFRPSAETFAKIEKIAEANGLSTSAVINLALAGGLNIVETKLSEIRDTPEAAAVAGAH